MCLGGVVGVRGRRGGRGVMGVRGCVKGGVVVI